MDVEGDVPPPPASELLALSFLGEDLNADRQLAKVASTDAIISPVIFSMATIQINPLWSCVDL